jgi:Cu+-exporting ATPase
MTCAACAARVQKAISKLEGVENVVVNFATEKASFSYDPNVLRLATIKEAVVKAGYKILDTANADEDKARKERAVRVLWIKFIISAVFALPLLYIAMVPMIKFVRLPFPMGLDPMMSPLVYAITEIALVIPCIAVGYRFYTVGFKALFMRSPNMDSLIAVGTSAAVIYST